MGDTDSWIQQVTAPTLVVACWIQQSVSPEQVVGFTCVFNSEIDQLIWKFTVRATDECKFERIMVCLGPMLSSTLLTKEAAKVAKFISCQLVFLALREKQAG